MYTLGINAVFHDSAAALVRDGRLIAASEEERFTRIKHGKRPQPFSAYELPFFAIHDCLRQAGIRLSEVENIAYSFDPALAAGHASVVYALTLDPLFLDAVKRAPGLLTEMVPHLLQDRFAGAGVNRTYQWHFVEHHTAHAASAFLASPFRQAAVLTLDGRGERATTSCSLGAGSDLQRLVQIDMPHSLGLLYEQVTRYLGYLHASDEYKVMALASYGRPAYRKEFRDIVRWRGEGRYEIAPTKLEERFGRPRARGAKLESRHFDIARSLQEVLEETALELARWLHRQAPGLTDLCLAGGVALNCVMNARLRDEGPFRNLWVQPAAGDAGTALGAALWIDARERKDSSHFVMEHPFWGPGAGAQEIEDFLRWTRAPFRRLTDAAEETAALLAQEKIVGWFQERMEFGPRALGARSILASPLKAEMRARINDIKDREDYRPVAPVVLEEEAEQWFSARNGARKPEDGTDSEIRASPSALVSPFMLFAFDVRPEKAARIPAVRHVDGTARVQTVRRDQNPPLYDLLKAFERRTGVPLLINTSFNTRGEPIVCTPRDAVECFWSSPLDALIIGPYLLEKTGAAVFSKAPRGQAEIPRSRGEGVLTTQS